MMLWWRYTLLPGKAKIQSLAYSHDNGSTFTKFKGNPIIPNQREARDPNMFWHEPSQQWIMVLADALEQQMQIYTSPDLKEWTYQSSFGKGYGSQFGVWECPDLMEIEVEGTKTEKMGARVQHQPPAARSAAAPLNIS